ncbi:hypothetical protein KFL_004630110 [Klebsormidium nitens]|uniref:Uncharacterized protein n=1 Tax=Klebsormidium nitens TaxID=105231 RepID=A0A1Y1IE24_KLENI|nr:hypothetical protein KFL_004630110 [Klebsormidium nitens]|eukprot:GAQ88843.1 hypothetical protein KFL_004630110 [Klebsormidium nitens]
MQSQALRVQHRNQLRKQSPSILVAAVKERRMQGGNSKPTLVKMAKRVESLLRDGFVSLETRQNALYQNYIRHRKEYQLITTDAVNSKAAFEKLCRLHPVWLHPHQRAVVKAIEEAWTLNQCLAVQIHCKVGHGGKWQALINLLGKTYDPRLKEWIPLEIMGKGSKIFLPLLKSKNRVNDHREALHAIIPLLQNKDGTACWADLKQLIEETVKQDREKGYLQSRAQLAKDKLWLHWGGDAAGWIRGQSHSIWGFKLLGNQRVVTHSPKDMRVALIFEGKDKYSTYQEYLQPFLEHMDDLAYGGMQIDNTAYDVDQTLGADYVLMCELLGHSGASALTGCCFCEQHKDNYGKACLNAEGWKVPLPAKPCTTESMAAATHRPWTTGPDVDCPYYHEPFPDQDAVKNSKAPETKQQVKNFQQSHAGMRFGTPPLFKFPITAYVICILHLLLRLMAITFLRTVAENLNTPEKTEAVNALIKALHLGCKKLEQRKTSGDKKKDTQDINFIGREARVLLHPDAYNTFLDIAILDDAKRAAARKIWDNLASFYTELLKPLTNPEDAEERLGKSIVVQDKAVAYVESYTAELGTDRATLYMHQAMSHVPEMVQRFPVDISDMSQQFVEAKLKEGKTDMLLFTNRRLVDEKQQKGRNLQVMAKGRERIALAQTVTVPVSRNERRYLGDGSKAAEQTIERARRRGQLVSRSQAQINNKLAKLGPEITRVFLGYKNIVGKLTGEEEEGESDNDPSGERAAASASIIRPSNTSGVQLGPATVPGAEGVVPGAGAATEGGSAAPAIAGGELIRGSGGGVRLAVGGEGGAPAAAAGRERGRARGGRGGRGRGRTTGGRVIPASARPI